MDDDRLTLLEHLYEEIRGVRRDLRPDDRLADDLALDSLAVAELMTALEEELGVSLIDDEHLPLARTVGDVLSRLEALQPT
jgi:acyl carrier protein